MSKKIVKALCKNACCICKAIDEYLTKADDDLEETLAGEGFVEAEDTVKAINDLEEGIAGALKKQTKKFAKVLDDSSDWNEIQERVADLDDSIEDTIKDMTSEMFREKIPKYANVYIKNTDSELVVSTIRNRTSKWIDSWSARLGELMKVNTHEQISKLIGDSISDGKSISELSKLIKEGGWRSEYYQAKRVALTEVLRAHSVAEQESYMQSPAVTGKMWVHAGGSLNYRENHMAMNGVIVAKSEPFILVGADGLTYYPMYPRDSILPAVDSINCQCIMQPIVSQDILGLSYEERKAMQEEILAGDDD